MVSFSVGLGSLAGASDLPEKVALGVRPETLQFADAPGEGVVDVEVELVEPLGSEIYLHGRVGDQPLVARLGPDHPVQVGDRIRLAMDLGRIHFFDGESGAALRPAPSQVA